MCRRYDTSGYRKHKNPGGWGSLCPVLDPGTPQVLLDSGVQVGDAVYNVDDDYAFCARHHGRGCWHGYPIPWARLPIEAKNKLISQGRLTSERYSKALRKNLGRESK